MVQFIELNPKRFSELFLIVHSFLCSFNGIHRLCTTYERVCSFRGRADVPGYIRRNEYPKKESFDTPDTVYAFFLAPPTSQQPKIINTPQPANTEMKRICQDASVSMTPAIPIPIPPSKVVPPDPSIPVVEAQVLHRLPADVVCEQGAADPVPPAPPAPPSSMPSNRPPPRLRRRRRLQRQCRRHRRRRRRDRRPPPLARTNRNPRGGCLMPASMTTMTTTTAWAGEDDRR